MKYFSYAWLVIRNVIILLIAWLLYSIATSNFEIIIISLLLIIYAYINNRTCALAHTLVTMSANSTKQFLHILKILKKSDSLYKTIQASNKNEDEHADDPGHYALKLLYFEDEDSKQRLQKQDDELKTITIMIYISGPFTFLIYVLALWKIIIILF
ncbi:MAG: hypothetical protein ABSB79_11825 [Syntrophales bacterium]